MSAVRRQVSAPVYRFGFSCNDSSNTHTVFHKLRLSQVVAAKPLQKGSQYIPPNHGYNKFRSSLAVARGCLSNNLGRRCAGRLGRREDKKPGFMRRICGLHPRGKGKEGGRGAQFISRDLGESYLEGRMTNR